MKIRNEFFEQNNSQASPLIKLCRCNELPAKTSYWLSRLLQKLEPLNAVYNNERKKLIEKWCDKTEDGAPEIENGLYKLKAHSAEFNVEFQELLDIEIDVDGEKVEIFLDKIPAGVLNSYDYGRLVAFIDFKE